MPVIPTHRQAAASHLVCCQVHRAGVARNKSLKSGLCRQVLPQGTCQGSGANAQGCHSCNITSGGFSYFIVKQQKLIYTPTSLNV